MAQYASFRELVAWQKGMDLTEGGAYRYHVAIALGSNAEVQTHLELLGRLSLVDRAVVSNLLALAQEVGCLLFGLWRALAIKTVCYSVGLLTGFLGLWPLALGLVNGLPLFP